MSKIQQQDRAGALIEKIRTDSSNEAARILAEANAQAADIKRQARRKARLKVHEIIENLRDRETREMAHETARFETERRQWRQADEREALAEGLTHLDAALTDLWAEQDSRKQWCHNLLAVAQQRLPTENWRVQHPAGFPQDELTNLSNEIRLHTGTMPELNTDNSLHAGLRIYAGTACVDGSSAAITADRQKTSARFLSVLLSIREEGRA